ncbi:MULTISPECIES: adenylate/guanylate cyclase domain-containing protein [Bradyrhizobium]|jgi:adenylate cyclase|uniref:adenylate/guanylate cyclase domain-containing protein n=1 Tax=Bradyrhizobium TaxID=374 RepID=UPI000417D42F|nr:MULTISPECIES: adenylate/guanylate cyclase domain-containing protein [Bradyrhizobium]AUC93688.1 adenylate/guanylate cyclase domain-containing protein [Bradyrhizobium sp. SK17]KIU49867.1 adenylate cyclase [Bradyrhizobium elkanii]MBK5654280.1 adenylate/guanylate cyclase domain-containing protein [Rhizobium sp.]OCX32053.1 adenylate cyclase [Bradyrhizobium sp. UASWS1016]
MNAKLERQLRFLAAIIVAGVLASVAVNIAQGRAAWPQLVAAISYTIVSCVVIGGLELFVLQGPLSEPLRRLSFVALLAVRSAIYAVLIIVIQLLQVGERVAGFELQTSPEDFWRSIAYSGVISVILNLGFSIANLIGPRVFMNFVSGRYHSPVEENRFVLFVDIAGSTGLAERLGGIGIHRFLDRTFRLLTESVVDYRGEVLNYIGDEIIVTWPEGLGAVDCRPLRCFVAMRAALQKAAPQFEREFGAVPQIRGSLHFGPVIVGEIGDVKPAIVFNGDVMNTAARLEELSRKVDGGFLASRAAMSRFAAPPPFPVNDLGTLPIRGRVDGIDVVGIGAAA